ncbi:MAG: hypothetical protein AAGA30_02460 [Planctomycetota bacterium]
MENKFVSGEWNGFYLEPHRTQRGWMHLYLAFDDGQIKGEGTDYVGPWIASGTYDESSGNCRWVKQYVGKHQVVYNGQCSENGIQGKWTIFSEGPFHIWPKTHGHFNELYLREELENQGDLSPSIILEPVDSGELLV